MIRIVENTLTIDSIVFVSLGFNDTQADEEKNLLFE
jgi:hypothetical protein